MLKSRLKIAFLITWIVISAYVLLALSASFALSLDAASRLIPPCEWKLKHGRECPLCGMTRSFIAAARGDLEAASAAHPLGPPLFFLFFVNETACGASLAALATRGASRRAQKGVPCRSRV